MSYLKRILYNCNKATYLIEKRQLTTITLREAIELRIHFLGCYFCRLYDKQSKVINSMIKELFNDSFSSDIKLSDTFKKELHDKIEEGLNKD